LTDRVSIETALRGLFARQRLAALATTEADGHPYANLMAFAASRDLKSLVLVTGRSTRKYDNLCADPRVALLIDDRSHDASDIHEAMAVTILGDAREVPEEEQGPLLDLYLGKHPHLEEFASSPSCALFEVVVRSYYLVRRFQEVTELHVRR
jgi:nitroimidazol reductase NimA-like FMN-containing flavoprotein (pyridoxamine 5'-phosphate oxidase superfamily)